MNAISLPCADLSSGATIRFAIKWQVIGLLLMVSHVVLVKQSVVFTPLMFLALGWLYANAPLAGFVCFLQVLIYQNWIIGLLITGMERTPTFTVLQGTNFGALVIMAGIAWARLAIPRWRNLQPLLIVVAIALVAAVLYTGIGATKEGLTSASIYFRSTTALTFGVLVGLDLGRVYGFRTIALTFLTSVALSIALAYTEVLAPIPYYELTNAVGFSALKTLEDPKFDMFYSAQDVVFHNQVVLFNVSGSDSVYQQTRFLGTVMHPISYAYVIATAALLAWSIGYGGWLVVLLPLLVLTGVKGANLLFVCSMALWVVWTLTRHRMVLFGACAVLFTAYISFGIIFGENSGDYHVLGFLGGLHSLFNDPLGHGIGVGGNLSSNAANGFSWQHFQAGGVSFALESAVGVLFYQMGVAAASVLAVFFVLLSYAPFQTQAAGTRLRNRHALMFIVLGTVAVNGVFQEEAYAPTAAGIFTLFCAVIIANGNRSVGGLVSALKPRSGMPLANVRTGQIG